jgi:hypothetical protein
LRRGEGVKRKAKEIDETKRTGETRRRTRRDQTRTPLNGTLIYQYPGLA